MPTVPVSPGATAPADVLWKAYSEGGRILWEGARGTYKTLGAAIVTFWRLVREGKLEVKQLGGSKEQAENGFRYLRNFLLSTPAAQRVKDGPHHGKVEMYTGSTAAILTHSNKSVMGKHPTDAIGDEVDEWDWDVLQAFLGSLQRAWLTLFISTNHNPGGPMSVLKREAAERGFEYHRTTVFECMRCDRDSCAECQAATKPTPSGDIVSFYDICKRSDGQMKAKLADGFLTVESALHVFRSLDYRSALPYMFCEGAKAEGLVYYAFHPDINVQPVEYDPSFPIIEGWDEGVENPTVCLIMQQTGMDQVRVLGEMYIRRAGAMQIAEAYRDLRDRLGIPDDKPADRWGDPAGLPMWASLREQGISIGSASVKGPGDSKVTRGKSRWFGSGQPEEKKGGVVKSRAELNRRFEVREDGAAGLLVDPSCRELIRELSAHKYREGTDEVEKKHDHGPDALRYAVWMIQRPVGLPPSSPLENNGSREEKATTGAGFINRFGGSSW